MDNAFNLIFAFDEIVALGYRESVNLSQIRTFVEMDSHEEKVYQAVRQVSVSLILLAFRGIEMRIKDSRARGKIENARKSQGTAKTKVGANEEGNKSQFW